MTDQDRSAHRAEERGGRTETHARTVMEYQVKPVDQELFESLRDRYLEESKDEWRSYAREQRLLPLKADLGGLIMLRVDGELLSIGWDREAVGPVVEPDSDLRLAAVTVGVLTFPELEFLLPEKPSDALPCQQCGGDGWCTIADNKIQCGYCLGLGWTAS